MGMMNGEAFGKGIVAFRSTYELRTKEFVRFLPFVVAERTHSLSLKKVVEETNKRFGLSIAVEGEHARNISVLGAVGLNEVIDEMSNQQLRLGTI